MHINYSKSFFFTLQQWKYDLPTKLQHANEAWKIHINSPLH